MLKYLLRTHLCNGAEAAPWAAPQVAPSLPSSAQSTQSLWKTEPYPTIQSFMNINLGLCWMAEGNSDPESANISVDLIANGSPGCSWEHQSLEGPPSPDAAQGPQHQHHPINWMHGTIWEQHTILVGNWGSEPAERLTRACLGSWPLNRRETASREFSGRADGSWGDQG